MRGTVAKRLRYAALKSMDPAATATNPVSSKTGTRAHLPGTMRSTYKDLKLTRKRDLLFNGARWCSRGIMKANWCANITELQFALLAQKYVPAAREHADRLAGWQDRRTFDILLKRSNEILTGPLDGRLTGFLSRKLTKEELQEQRDLRKKEIQWRAEKERASKAMQVDWPASMNSDGRMGVVG